MMSGRAKGLSGSPSSETEVKMPRMLVMVPLRVVASISPILCMTVRLKSIPTDIMAPPSRILPITGRFCIVTAQIPCGSSEGASTRVMAQTNTNENK